MIAELGHFSLSIRVGSVGKNHRFHRTVNIKPCSAAFFEKFSWSIFLKGCFFVLSYVGLSLSIT